jgi:hypothetical protein
MGAVYPVAPLTMQWCLDCHRDPDEHLRPQWAITDMEWRPSESRRTIGARIRAERDIAPPVESCTGCHR